MWDLMRLPEDVDWSQYDSAFERFLFSKKFIALLFVLSLAIEAALGLVIFHFVVKYW